MMLAAGICMFPHLDCFGLVWFGCVFSQSGKLQSAPSLSLSGFYAIFKLKKVCQNSFTEKRLHCYFPFSIGTAILNLTDLS